MSFFKLLSLIILIGITLTQMPIYEDCSKYTDISNPEQITPEYCLNTAMPHGKFCCYLSYEVSEETIRACKSLDFDAEKNEMFYKSQVEPYGGTLVCPQIAEEITNNCGAVGITVPKSGINCTYARIPEQHCCYVEYKRSNSEEKSAVCRHYSKFIKEIDDDNVKEDMKEFEVGIEILNVDCSHSFIKYSFVFAMIIMISFI